MRATCDYVGPMHHLPSLRFDRFCFTSWCAQPWTLHAIEDGRAAVRSISLVDNARIIFHKYDVNHNNRIDMSELRELLLDLNLERLEVSVQSPHCSPIGRVDWPPCCTATRSHARNSPRRRARLYGDTLVRRRARHMCVAGLLVCMCIAPGIACIRAVHM